MRSILSLLLLCLCLPLWGITLFENGVVKSAIVLPENATDPVRFAASELSLWLHNSSGLEWQIYEGAAPEGLYPIYLGDSEFARSHGFDRESLQKDGYLLEATAEYLLIAGRDYPGGILQGFVNPYRHVELYNRELKLSALGEMGTYFGVKEFLESYLGIRYYMMGPDGTVCPHHDALSFDAFSRRNAPAFAYRYAYFAFLSQYPQEALWYRRAGFGGDSPRDINHAYWQMEDQKDAHPEYFAIIDGRPDTDSRSILVHWGGNYCLSNPGLQQAWVDKICDYFETHPQNILYPLSPNDGTYRVCECPACQAQVDLSMGEDGKFSNLVWGFTNRVAKEVGKRFPDRQIGTFAYEHYRKPPTNIEKFEPNVATLVCHTQRQQTDPQYKAHIREVLHEWRQRLNHVYSYTYPHKDYWKPQRGYPSFYPYILQDDLKFERDEQIGGFFMESEFHMEKSDEFSEWKIYQPGLSHLTAYVTSKLEWNPDLDLKALLDEYYRLFYGPAEAPMRAFWEKAEKISTSHPFHMNTHPATYYTRDDIQQFFAYLDQGLKLTPPDSVYHRRVQMIKDEMEPYSGRYLRSTKLRMPIEVRVTDKTISLTDALDAAPWTQAQKYDFVDPFGEPAQHSTEVSALADKEGLSIAILCHEPAMDKLTTKATLFDQGLPWDDDCVEIFWEQKDGSNGMQLIVTANGTLWDGHWANAEQRVIDNTWNSHAQAKVTQENGKWVAVVKIPWTDLGVTLETAETLHGNIYRTRVAGEAPTHTCLVPIMGFLHRNTDFFGPLKLIK